MQAECLRRIEPVVNADDQGSLWMMLRLEGKMVFSCQSPILCLFHVLRPVKGKQPSQAHCPRHRWLRTRLSIRIQGGWIGTRSKGRRGKERTWNSL
jgi:hypothetical protein